MTPTLLDTCARIILANTDGADLANCTDIARKLIATLRPAVLEEAAWVCDHIRESYTTDDDPDSTAGKCARDIRALATPTDTEKDTP